MTTRMPSWLGFSSLLACFLLLGVHQSLQAQETRSPLTAAESSGFRETTGYDDLMGFLAEVTGKSSKLHLTSMGTSSEERSIPLVVVGAVDDPSPEGVKASGKTRFYVQGGIHAGEISGKEALLILLRELAGGQHAEWADSLVLLIAPLYNPDGNERVSPTNRRGQHGPVEGMGQRPNAMGLDLNRDQMKLDAPESRALVGLYSAYDPHLSVDLHTTNGSHHGYHLTYAPPLPPSTPREIDEYLRGRWLPEITRAVKDATGWDMYYYGGARPARGDREAGWYTFSHQPRYVSNYIGLRNRFGILGEAYSYASFEERIGISYWFTREVIEFGYRNASEVRARTEQADARSIVGESLGVQFEVQRSDEPVTILMGDVIEEENPVSGQRMLLRTDTQTPTEMYEYGTFRPTEVETVPPAYFVPSHLTGVFELLAAHGIRTVAVHEAPSGLEVEEFRIDSIQTSEREYQGHQAQQVWGEYGSPRPAALPRGTIMVPMDQPLARVAFRLLEPRSDDGLVAWGLLRETLTAGQPYPIQRSVPGRVPGLSFGPDFDR
ncbi:MAG: M14 family metallopeptidase [Gemmatimonadetes bacterium]|nr:M14 family metallopeptidase [Gemmatimonadota bacterium]